MPGANARALEKARDLPCDVVIFDLEDAVAPDAKTTARAQVLAAVRSGAYGYRELLVRCNALETPWGAADLATFAGEPVAGLLFPKIERLAQIDAICAELDRLGGRQVPLWIMIETPIGVLDARSLAAHPRVAALVMGTSDLVKELHATHTPSRSNLHYALQHCVLAARAAGKVILDGVHLEFRNLESFRDACEQGRAMGFDGKTLIHPGQVDIANETYGIDSAGVDHARRVLAVWQDALAAGRGVAVLDGNLVENLHAAEAERVVAFADALAARG
ncbi:MAG: CoA ester lyase [Pseudomonadales bacterium]|nr:CoA ester lyase [Pseudomonadales bacterium]